MSTAIARTGDDGGDDQNLFQHLAEVARRASELASSIRPTDEVFSRAAAWAGWLHDLGKYRDEFQQYIRGKRNSSLETQHAVFGAAWADRNGLTSIALAINGHHAGLHDFSNVKNALTNPDLAPRAHAHALMEMLLGEPTFVPLPLLKPPPEWLKPTRKVLAQFAGELRIRMLFSCLIDADRLDSEKHTTGKEREPKPFHAKSLFDRLDAFVTKKSAAVEPTEVNRIRGEIYTRCKQAAQIPQGYFSLTAPTGSGKTLASMAFALEHARIYKLRRVIIVLPFLAIIEQNAAVYREALATASDTDMVLEHHSAATEPESSTPEGESEDQSSNRRLARQATENWDAPVIVTTAVQFLESLFARSPSRCRKLHNIARSVVVFDEVQTLPFDLLDPILSAVRDLRNDYGVSFLFSSATQPKFEERNLPSGFAAGECHEIVPEPVKTFTILRRANLELPFLTEEPWSWNDLADRLENVPRALIVVNLRKHAQDLHDVLKQRRLSSSVFHLSATMCSAHRRKTLGDKADPERGSIYATLAAGGPCIVVSTQVIEAGVDIDFPVVFRALAPLDAIIQAAGRCDREGHLTRAAGRPAGRVIVFVPSAPGIPQGFYKLGANEARMHLARLCENPDRLFDDPAIFAAYHQSLLRLGEGRQRSEAIQKARQNLEFEEVDRKFRIIDDGGQSVVVSYGRSAEIVTQIQKQGRVTLHQRRLLQRYMVNLYMPREALLGGIAQPIVRGDESLLEFTGQYRNDIGLVLGERSVDEFVL